MKLKHSFLLPFFAIAAASSARAEWTGTLTPGGSHDYNNTANWSGGGINDTFLNNPTVNPSGVTISFSADRTTVNNANGVTGRGLHLAYGGPAGLTLEGNGGGTGAHTLTLSGNVYLGNLGNVTTVIGSTTAGSQLNVNLGGATRTFGGDNSGRSIRLLNTVSNGGIVIENGIRIELASTSNNFAGGVVVKNGTLASYGNVGSTAFGTGTITLGDTTGSANATLDHRNGSTNVANAIFVAGGNTGIASIAPQQGNNTFSGPITLANNLRIAPSTGGTNAFTGGITGTGNLRIEQSGGSTTTSFSTGALNFSGSITNASTAGGANGVQINSTIGANVTSVTQNGALKMQLNGANVYTGGTTVSLGTLETGAAGTLGTGNVTVANLTTAFLTLGNAQSIANTAALYFGNDSSIALNYGSSTETIGALFNTTQNKYMTAGEWDASQLNAFFGGDAFTGTGKLLVTAIPEPSVSLSALLGLGALTLVRRRR